MASPKLPTAELTAEFSTGKRPKLLGYHVVIDGKAVAMITLDELALAGLSAADEVQTFEVAEPVKAGSLLFWRRSDQLLHVEPGTEGTPVGMTMRDLEAGAAVRLFRDGFIPLDAEFDHSAAPGDASNEGAARQG